MLVVGVSLNSSLFVRVGVFGWGVLGVCWGSGVLRLL